MRNIQSWIGQRKGRNTCLIDDRVVTRRSVVPDHILDLERLFVSGVDAVELLVVRKDGTVN